MVSGISTKSEILIALSTDKLLNHDMYIIVSDEMNDSVKRDAICPREVW